MTTEIVLISLSIMTFISGGGGGGGAAGFKRDVEV